uniref:Ig-like domain-containing protein n=1 Tax=Callorhinchus milii TaxID=7868 RepID=A0A4W3GPZ9_CALMI
KYYILRYYFLKVIQLTCVQADLVLTQPPYLIGKTGQALRLTCESSGLDTTVAHMSWYRQLPGKQQENLLEYEGSSIKSFGSGFENRVIVIREDSQNIFDLIIKCPTVHDTSTYYFMYTKQPSVYLLLPSAEEMAAQQFVTLTCLVKDFAPKEIFVQWTVNDQLIDANKYRNTEVMADSENLNYSMYSMLTISADEWNRRPSYSCVVVHICTHTHRHSHTHSLPCLPRPTQTHTQSLPHSPTRTQIHSHPTQPGASYT